jgi:hypothetical protein
MCLSDDPCTGNKDDWKSFLVVPEGTDIMMLN